MSVAPRTLKYLDLSEKLEKLIGSGEWAERGKAPPLRTIASRFRVSVVTASRALQLLAQRGLIQTIDRSGTYLTPPAKSAATEQWGLYMRITPGIWRQAGYDFSFQRMRHGLRDENVELLTDLFPSDAKLAPREWRLLVRQTRQSGVRGVFFLPSRLDEESALRDLEFLNACRDEKMPVVLIERSIRGACDSHEWDLVAADNVEAGRICTQHLIDLKRKRIALVVASPTSSHMDRAAGYLHALYLAGISCSRIIELPSDLPGREAYGWCADQLTDFDADAVICYHDYNAVGLVMELLRRGVRVPRDIAVVGFENYPIGDSFSIGLTTINFPVDSMARHALRLLRLRADGVNGSPIKIQVPVQLIVRESTVERGGLRVESPAAGQKTKGAK